jgi:hypothetical protein
VPACLALAHGARVGVPARESLNSINVRYSCHMGVHPLTLPEKQLIAIIQQRELFQALPKPAANSGSTGDRLAQLPKSRFTHKR